MRRPNHASRFEGIAKTNLQASRASDTEILQSQVNKAAKKRLSLNGLEILHGRRSNVVVRGRSKRCPCFFHVLKFDHRKAFILGGPRCRSLNVHKPAAARKKFA